MRQEEDAFMTLSVSPITAATTQVYPPAFHIMLKPRGAICNLGCEYCYFLSKEQLYPASDFRMTDDLLETVTREYIAAQQVPEVTFGWQGGEPTLMGLPFFRRAVALQAQYRRPGMKITNALQTNGTLLDDEWCQFFKEHGFLIGLSIDGPRNLHDRYRVDKGGGPTFDRVTRGLACLKRHQVEFNVLTTVHAGNADHGLAVYRFLRDQVGARFIQFIPIVERDTPPPGRTPPSLAGKGVGGLGVTDRSVTARQYGDFLSAIFDEWVRRDVGRVFVQIFDVALAAWAGYRPGLCVFEETCGLALALEHNGDLYACDHFVEPAYLLGNIREQPLIELVASDRQRAFGQAKRDKLPRYCRACQVRFVCNGGCPKNRLIETPDGEPGLNYLCAGYRAFFSHIADPMRFMAAQLASGQPPANVMGYMARRDAELARGFATAGRNDPCPCGSGRKFKDCHGRLR